MWVGVDVSKEHLDVYLSVDGTSRRYLNTAAGIGDLLSALPQGSIVCYEATGRYQRQLTLALYRAGVEQYQVNPLRVKRYIQSRGRGDKTDQIDAQAIAEYGEQNADRLHAPLQGHQQELQDLRQRIKQLDKALMAERNRLEQVWDEVISRQLEASIEFLEGQKAQLAAELDARISADTEMSKTVSLLETIPGVGAATARTLISSIPQLRSFASAGALTAYVGTAPQLDHSGKTSKSWLPNAARKDVRSALYMPTLTAIRVNPDAQRTYERLVANGKPKKVALLAAMNKLVRICYGVIKNQTPYAYSGA